MTETTKIGGTTVHVTGLHINAPKSVKLIAEIMGPKESLAKYKVNADQLEQFVVFQSTDDSPIGFALIEAAKAMPRKKIHTSTSQDHFLSINIFDMPVRHVAGIRTAIKALDDAGYTVYIDPDLYRLLLEVNINDEAVVEVSKQQLGVAE